ncbi:Hypothetical predicted protein [Paramuricea clavata]|nr:Hypothetical predicted protein [Paramuricea clavata]
MHTNSEIPPWVMTRFDDIPTKFWNQKEDPFESADEGEDVPLVNEPSDEAIEEIPIRLPKTFPSKFGTYLEPVTEEAELSSQGSVALSPMKNISFESTRSTLKANSQDGPENMAKIPSLCDLWQNTEDEGEVNSEAYRSEDHGIASDDTGNNMPASNIPEEIDQGYNGDWIDKNRDNSIDPWSSTLTIAEVQPTTAEDSPVNPWSWTPAIADIQDIPAISSGQWSSPQTDTVPSLSAYLTDNNTPVSEGHRESLEVESEPTDNRCQEVTNSDKLTKPNTSNNLPDLTPKHPRLSIPILTISEPVEKSRKISTVNAPDIDKLLPIIWPDKSEETNSQSNKKNTAGKGKVSCDTRQTKPTQWNMYGSQQWATLGSKRQPQISFSNKGKPKVTRKLSSRSRKTVDTKVTLSVSQCRKALQVTLPCENDVTNIPCFSDLGVECSNRPGKTCSETSKTSAIQFSGCSETSKTSTIQNSDDFEAFKNPRRTFTSFEQTKNSSSAQWNFGQSEKSNAVHCNIKKRSEKEDETRINDVYSDEHFSSKKEECLGAEKPGAHLNHGISIEEELDGLQNSLKGVKMYKAGIHLIQLASSIETVMCSEKRPKRLQGRSSERLLDSIQGELKHLEEYILRLQKQLKGIKKQGDGKEERSEEAHRRGSDFSDITRQLLQEQLRMFSSISSAAVSPTSSASVSREPSLCSDTPDVLRHTDVMKLRKEMQQLRQDSVEQNASMKEEILDEVRAEIRKCFKEFLKPESS